MPKEFALTMSAWRKS